MPDEVLQILGGVAKALEIAGASILVAGFVVATTLCIVRSFRTGVPTAVARYRQSLGRAVLIGLEILVAATIIKTMTVEATVEGISFLAIIVAIRTALGWTTALEIYGRWPWQKPQPEP